MKKVLSLVLVLSMILGSFGMAFAATPSDVVGTNYEDAVNVLTELGVVEGYKDGTYKPGNIVTRAEMATLIVKALGLNDYAVGRSSFTDMNGHWADPYVAYATSLGVLSGYTDGTFRPNQTVTYDQAITMLVQALGYKGEYLVGGYPGAYVAQAKTLGILDNVKSGTTGANRGDIATMIYNALPASFVRYDNNGLLQRVAQNYNPREDEDPIYDTMLRRLGAYADNNAFVIHGDEDSLINLQKYVGAYVTVYRDEDEDGDILAINEVKSVFISGNFELEENETVTVAALDSGDVEFTDDDDVTYTIRTDAYEDYKKAADTFGNGDDAKGFSSVNGDDDYTLAVKLSGKRITGLYSISTWNVTEDNHRAKVEAEDLELIEEDHELLGAEFEEDNNDEIDLTKFALLGVDSLDDIREDNIVYVYEGDRYIKRIEVGTQVVSGTISRINSSGKKITVAGTTYDAYDGESFTSEDERTEVEIDGASSISTGDEVRLYLDYSGDIFYIEVIDADADLMGIVIDVARNESGLNGNDGKVKMFLSDGNTRTFSIDDDDLDGNDFNDMLADGSITAGAIVYYGLNNDGQLDALEPADAADKRTASGDITSRGYFDGRRIASDAVIFTADRVSSGSVDVAESDWDDELGVGKYDNLLGKDDVSAVYYYDSSVGTIQWIVVEGGTTSDGIFAVYNGYASIDGDADYEVYLMVDGTATTYESDERGNTLVGNNPDETLYEVTLDSNGRVDKLEPVSADLDEDYATATCDVLSTNRIRNSVVTSGDDTYTLDSEVIIYVWDEDDEEWRRGSTSAIRNEDDYQTVYFYDVVDADKVYDVVLVK